MFLHKNLSKLIKEAAKETVRTEAEKTVKYIKVRTASGRDLYGRPFARYSTAYARRKGSDIPNLKLTGEMLGSIRISGPKSRSRKNYFSRIFF